MDSLEQFESALRPIVAEAERDAIAQCWIVRLAANRPPWTPSGIELSAGDRVSVFSAGRASIAAAPEIWVGSHCALWMRVGIAGEIFRTPGRSYTFTAQSGGELYLCNLFPGDWADRHGALATDPRAYDRIAGTIAVLVVRWKAGPQAGLERLAAGASAGAAIMRAEAERLKHPALTPAGWHYMWSIGDSGVFDSGRGVRGEPIIRCRVNDDATILQRPVHLKFNDSVRLRWSWKIDALPASEREDAVPTHDYLSIAVEFDNGQDLTYMWSAAMTPERSFRCPIPRWSKRETHMVVRSGKERLGERVSEERGVWDDYRRAIGTQPANIVAVWLIAVSVFTHTDSYCEFSDIELAADNQTIPLIAPPG
ncbi:MAG TPA: DUF3047 domain-containing protein [Candidatus Binataceae bacterium]|nr:DUF3047 domain-containing protein [Candidatus Binataceae bacterium]